MQHVKLGWDGVPHLPSHCVNRTERRSRRLTSPESSLSDKTPRTESQLLIPANTAPQVQRQCASWHLARTVAAERARSRPITNGLRSSHPAARMREAERPCWPATIFSHVSTARVGSSNTFRLPAYASKCFWGYVDMSKCFPSVPSR